MDWAENSINFRPVGPAPVKVKTSTSLDKAMACPASEPYPVTTCKTPGGNPASKPNSASLSKLKEALSAGFKITLFPAAKAGPIFQAPIIKGKFHGTIAPTTPIGSFLIRPRIPSAVGAISP